MSNARLGQGSEETADPAWLLFSPVCDPSVAVPAFDPVQCLRLPAPLLDREASAAAVLWNKRHHPTVSRVDPAHIRTDLARYVSFTQVQRAIDAHNRVHPARAIGEGTPPIDAVFAEAVHQFQAKVFLERSQLDGKAGQSTLASLGIAGYSGTPLNTLNQPNPGAQRRLRKVDVMAETRGEFTAASWYSGMVNPSFLGWRFRAGVHLLLVRRLRMAEQWLLSLPSYQGSTPVELGRALGFDERTEEHKGARPTTLTASMHTYGLALDVRYTSNPYVRGAAFSGALKRAALLVSGLRITHRTAQGFFNSLVSNPALSTAVIFAMLSSRNEDFRAYLRLHNNLRGIQSALVGRRADGTPGVFASRGEVLHVAARRWRTVIRRDLQLLRAQTSPFWMKTTGRDPLKGFLDLPVDLVVALRDQACLAWGAVDFGPRASGDVMHFDARVCGIGARLAAVGGNFRVTQGHHCLPCEGAEVGGGAPP